VSRSYSRRGSRGSGGRRGAHTPHPKITRSYVFYYFYTTIFCFFPLKNPKNPLLASPVPKKILKGGGGADGNSDLFSFLYLF